MPIASPETYAEMLDRAKAGGFAYPAINVTSSETLNAALRGFADAGSDGIIQVSTGGAEFASGTKVKEMVTGAVGLAEFAHVVADKYPIHVALHTDHCPKDKLDAYVRPLIAISQNRVNRGENPLFQSHMWDGSAVPLEENLQIAAELLGKAAAAKIVLELEIGVVGGEEDGVTGAIDEKLYTTADDALRTAEVLGTGEKGRYLLAATFGNVHGVYKPGNVKLRPEVLKEIQDAVGDKVGKPRPFALVFHGGSGSELDEIREAGSAPGRAVGGDSERPVAGQPFEPRLSAVAHCEGRRRVRVDIGQMLPNHRHGSRRGRWSAGVRVDDVLAALSRPGRGHRDVVAGDDAGEPSRLERMRDTNAPGLLRFELAGALHVTPTVDAMVRRAGSTQQLA